MKIGIAGVGAIGGALNRWFLNNGVMPSLYDPPQGLTGNMGQCDAVFVCVPAPTDAVTLRQDLSIVEEILGLCKTVRTVFIRSSVLPGTCDELRDRFRLNVVAMPEFLTERVADYDMERQDIICGNTGAQRAAEIFQHKKKIIPMTNVEAELTKYAHNGFGTVKVAFANMVYKLAQACGVDYENIRKGVLMSGFVNAEHTKVPGPDGRLGYGGKCFPKDMDALIGMFESNEINATWLMEMQCENEKDRHAKKFPCPHSNGVPIDTRTCGQCTKEGRR